MQDDNANDFIDRGKNVFCQVRWTFVIKNLSRIQNDKLQ